VTAIDYDLEFLEDGRTIELISIGMVCDDGREYYAVNSDMPVDRILNHQWLKANVWPHLPLRGYKPPPQINALQTSDGVLDTTDTRVKPKWVIANEVRDFIQATDEVEPQLWADYGAYDHVALCQLWTRRGRSRRTTAGPCGRCEAPRRRSPAAVPLAQGPRTSRRR
jgi:hypothetical protein